MFCPKCSQEQTSGEQRFCSRCGFQLNVVKALLVNDATPAGGESSRSFNKRDATIGAILMFLAAVMVAVMTEDMPRGNNAKFSFLVIAASLLALLINLKPLFHYFVKRDPGSRDALPEPASTNRFAGRSMPESLPLSESVPADFYIPRAADTADMHAPRSVTESTTNLLKNN